MFRILAVSASVLVAVLVVAPLLGPARIDFVKAWQGEWPDAQLFFSVRWPRVLLAAIAGGALSISGVLFQAMLRDALATPYTLGVSSGASLGAVAAICLGLRSSGGIPVLWISAFVGAAAVLFLVMMIAWEGRRMSAFTLLLAGVTVNSVALALILLLHSLAGIGESFAIVHWLMGGIDPLDYPALIGLAALVLPVSALLCWQARLWNLMAVGEDWAAARGVAPGRMMIAGYLAGSLLTASVTAITGPIGFVGLVVPHALRLRFGADHRLLFPASFLLGAAFLVICDTVARAALAVEVPVSVVTAIVGGPVFIAMLRGKHKSLWM